MFFDVKAPGNKSTRDCTHIKLLKTPCIKALGISTKCLSESLIELCHRIKLLLQQKQAGNISSIFDEEIIAIVDKLLDYKCISTKQHNEILIKCNLSHA